MVRMWEVGEAIWGDLYLDLEGGPFVTAGAAVGRFTPDPALPDGLVLISEDVASVPPVLLLPHWADGVADGLRGLETGGGPASAVATGDLNGDGVDDIVLALPASNEVSIISSRLP